jgi:hypothetical protein
MDTSHGLLLSQVFHPRQFSTQALSASRRVGHFLEVFDSEPMVGPICGPIGAGAEPASAGYYW